MCLTTLSLFHSIHNMLGLLMGFEWKQKLIQSLTGHGSVKTTCVCSILEYDCVLLVYITQACSGIHKASTFLSLDIFVVKSSAVFCKMSACVHSWMTYCMSS